MTERAISFDCHDVSLVGILHKPAQARRRGILIVVGGGPQYRVGGHRQLTLWSRRLCADGYPVFRFDYRGMGDAQGDFRGFRDIDDDLRAAIDRFFFEVPEINEIVLWGECDASSAILFYAFSDPRVRGIVLLNPWVRTEVGEARTILRFYYLTRILQPSFWEKIFRGRFNPYSSLKSAIGLIRSARSGKDTTAVTSLDDAPISRTLPLTESMLLGMTRFKGSIMLVLSGRDLAAREFDDLVCNSMAWQEQLKQKAVTRYDMAEGDHTFSSAAQRTQVINWGLEWLRGW